MAFKMRGSPMQRNFPSAFKHPHAKMEKAANDGHAHEKKTKSSETVADPKEYQRQEQLKKESSVGPYTGNEPDGTENDSLLENIVEFVDPTGVSSWDDARRAYGKKDKGMGDYLDMAGAIPLIGKVPKVARGLKKGFDLYKASTKAASATVGTSRLLNFGDTASDIKNDNIK